MSHPMCLMAAVQLVGHGGFDQLRYSETIPVPNPADGEVLIRVAAAGVNNVDVNTRIGWYASEVTGDTEMVTRSGYAPAVAGWSGTALTFPRIQGADVCGHIVRVGSHVSRDRLGERVVVQSCLRSLADGDVTPWLGSDRDGGFAQFVTAPALDTYRVDSVLSNAELAAIPCAFSTAENLIARAQVSAGETVLVTGASGNVGLAAVQLAGRRGARVVAVAAPAKFRALGDLGADSCIARDDDLSVRLGPDSVDVVIDVVGGPRWHQLLDVLKRRGRYAVSGAIAGPMVQLDLRKLYLKDLTFLGCTTQDARVFPDLIGYLERGEIRPVVSRQYPLRDIVAAQEDFVSKKNVGKVVLIPPRSVGVEEA